MSRGEVHPPWCGLAHVCSADRPAGEHRSHPLTVPTTTGRLVVTRIRTVAGRDRLELRVVVDLPADPPTARHAAGQLVWRLGEAIATCGSTRGAR